MKFNGVEIRPSRGAEREATEEEEFGFGLDLAAKGRGPDSKNLATTSTNIPPESYESYLRGQVRLTLQTTNSLDGISTLFTQESQRLSGVEDAGKRRSVAREMEVLVTRLGPSASENDFLQAFMVEHEIYLTPANDLPSRTAVEGQRGQTESLVVDFKLSAEGFPDALNKLRTEILDTNMSTQLASTTIDYTAIVGSTVLQESIASLVSTVQDTSSSKGHTLEIHTAPEPAAKPLKRENTVKEPEEASNTNAYSQSGPKTSVNKSQTKPMSEESIEGEPKKTTHKPEPHNSNKLSDKQIEGIKELRALIGQANKDGRRHTLDVRKCVEILKESGLVDIKKFRITPKSFSVKYKPFPSTTAPEYEEFNASTKSFGRWNKFYSLASFTKFVGVGALYTTVYGGLAAAMLTWNPLSFPLLGASWVISKYNVSKVISTGFLAKQLNLAFDAEVTQKIGTGWGGIEPEALVLKTLGAYNQVKHLGKGLLARNVSWAPFSKSTKTSESFEPLLMALDKLLAKYPEFRTNTLLRGEIEEDVNKWLNDKMPLIKTAALKSANFWGWATRQGK
jgi:hypothetical protein